MEWYSLGLTSVADQSVVEAIHATGGILAVSCVCPCQEQHCRRYDRVKLFGNRTMLPGAGCVIPRCPHKDHPAGYHVVGLYELSKGYPALAVWRDDQHQQGRLSVADPQEVHDRWHTMRQSLLGVQAASFVAE